MKGFTLVAIQIIGLFISLIALVNSKNANNLNEHYTFAILTDTHIGSSKLMDLAPVAVNKNNDLDLDTFQMLMSRLQETLSATDYELKHMIVLGDLINHYTSGPFGSIEERINLLNTHFATLLETEKASAIPIAFVPGNNDSLSGNYQPFFNPDVTLHSAKEIAQNAHWEGFLSSKKDCGANYNHYACLVSEDKNGYYIEPLAPNLTLIVLNTVFFSARNHCNELCQNEISWLQEQLKNIKGSFVIAAHIPPGTDTHSGTLFWNEKAQHLFFNIIAPYADQLTAFFVSHTHMEELSFVQFKGLDPIPVVYTAGLSTSHGNAPAFKLIKLAYNQPTQRWTLADFRTYHFVIDKFESYYDAQKLYCSNEKPATFLSSCLATYLRTNKLNELQTLINQHLTAGNKNYNDIQRVGPEKLATYWN